MVNWRCVGFKICPQITCLATSLESGTCVVYADTVYFWEEETG